MPKARPGESVPHLSQVRYRPHRRERPLWQLVVEPHEEWSEGQWHEVTVDAMSEADQIIVFLQVRFPGAHQPPVGDPT